MDFGIVTYLAGIASLLGLVLQLFDAFPEYREVRKTVFLIVLGTFVGTLLSTFQHVSFKIEFPLTGFNILIGISLLVISILAILACFTTEQTKRLEIFTAAGIGLLALMFVLFFGSLIIGATGSKNINQDELNYLVDKNIGKGDINRAIEILEMIKNRLERKDPRYEVIKNKISELKGHGPSPKSSP
jgi:hypothetical protein